MTSPLRAMDPNAVAQDIAADLGIDIPPLVRMSKTAVLALANAALTADGKAPLTPLERMGEFGTVGNVVQERFVGEAPEPAAGSITYEAADKNVATVNDGGTHTVALTVSAAAGKERLVAIGAITNANGTVDFSACTIGGQAATRVGTVARGRFEGAGAQPLLTFFRAPGTAGTSINVVATVSAGPGGSAYNVAVVLWTLDNVGTLVAQVTSSPTVAPYTSHALNVNTATGGVIAAASYAYSNSPLPVTTWTGITKNVDGIVAFGQDAVSGASADVTTGQTPRTVSALHDANLSDSNDSAVASVISFNPA